jgi:hypothetical protein
MKLLELVEETFSSSHVVAGPSAIIKSLLLVAEHVQQQERVFLFCSAVSGVITLFRQVMHQIDSL